MPFTLQDAQAIVLRVRSREPIGVPSQDTPLIGKENSLLVTMNRAEAAHTAALALEADLPLIRTEIDKLRKTFVAALGAVEETRLNLATIDSDLDHSYENPESQGDLKGLLHRAVVGLDRFESELPDERRRTLRQPVTSDTGEPVKVKTSGLAALVAVIYGFWRTETELPFSYSVQRPENKGESKQAGSLALLLVYEVARSVDPGYTLDQCSNAMRPR